MFDDFIVLNGLELNESINIFEVTVKSTNIN